MSIDLNPLLNVIVEKVAIKVPDKIAVIAGDTQITYRELDLLGNRVAQLLCAHKLERNEPVFVLSSKSSKLIIVILGILKAGGVVVLGNIKEPIEILNKYHFKYVFCDEKQYCIHIKAHHTFGNCVCFLMDTFVSLHEFCPESRVVQYNEIFNFSDIKPRVKSISSDLAYIVFTSGSTGTPKGVMISHKSIAHVLQCRTNALSLKSTDRLLSTLSPCFDVFIMEVFMPLYKNATVVLLDQWMFPEEIFNMIEKHQCSIFLAIPTLFSIILKRRKNTGKYSLKSLQKIVFGGGKCRVDILKKIKGMLHEGINYYHGYGLAETSCHALYYNLQDIDNTKSDYFPLGVPIEATEIYIVDNNNSLVEGNGCGELVIRGVHLMQGYYDNQLETERVLRVNPYYHKLNEKVLYTGDLVRRDNQGNIYFVGRKDEQIKCMGYRIELGEIEAIISRYRDVSECKVIAVPDRLLENRICCYFSTINGVDITYELRKYCVRRMLSYMLPQEWKFMEQLPKNNSGKIDVLTLQNGTTSKILNQR